MEDRLLNPTNAVGDKINQQNRLQAIKALSDAKKIEADLIKNGAIWMKKDRTLVLVTKEKIEKYKSNGYKLSVIKNKKK
jgi:hypothetical protein